LIEILSSGGWGPRPNNLGLWSCKVVQKLQLMHDFKVRYICTPATNVFKVNPPSARSVNVIIHYIFMNILLVSPINFWSHKPFHVQATKTALSFSAGCLRNLLPSFAPISLQ